MSRPHGSASSPVDELRIALLQRASTAERKAERIIGWLALAILLALLAVGGLSSIDSARAQAESLPHHQSATSTRTSNQIDGTAGVAALDVACLSLVVDNMDRSIAFYRDVLSFKVMSDIEVAGDNDERLHGIFGLRLRLVCMQLGEERIELIEYLAQKGKPYPPDSRSNDKWFQHIAIITNDMDRAFAHLREHRVRHASTGPQLLPQWNKNAGGIRAFYFHDPDGHVLEILQFPPDKGNPKWHAPKRSDQLLMGIDHTAIVVDDTEQALKFYCDLLGMEVAGTSENYGTEQEHLNNIFGARLRITSVRPRNARGPSIEFLEYLTPRDGRPYPDDAKANDLLAWQTTIIIDDINRAMDALRAKRVRWISPGAISISESGSKHGSAVLVRDPDGHIVRLVQPSS